MIRIFTETCAVNSAASECQKLIMTDELVGEIHDRILDDNNLDLAHAYNQACVELASLYRSLDKLEKSVSHGFIRVKDK